MSKFTKQERNEIYKNALKIIVLKENKYMCNAIYESAFKNGESRLCVNSNNFPEFFSQKPINKNLFWFYPSDRKSRIAVLNKCTELTKPE